MTEEQGGGTAQHDTRGYTAMAKRYMNIFLSLVAAWSCMTISTECLAESVGPVDYGETRMNGSRPAIRETLAARARREGWPVEKLDTARKAHYLTEEEKNVFLALNMARSNPRKYGQLYITELLTRYSAGILSLPGKIPIATTEGLHRSAEDHAQEQSETGRTGHFGNGGSSPAERMKFRCQGARELGEVIAYGGSTGLDIINMLLVDDGVRDRGHRKLLLEGSLLVGGVSIETHPVYGNVAVMDLVDSCHEKNSPED
jgi:hypothetical protein